MEHGLGVGQAAVEGEVGVWFRREADVAQAAHQAAERLERHHIPQDDEQVDESGGQTDQFLSVAPSAVHDEACHPGQRPHAHHEGHGVVEVVVRVIAHQVKGDSQQGSFPVFADKVVEHKRKD